jgi:hypothetical protein
MMHVIGRRNENCMQNFNRKPGKKDTVDGILAYTYLLTYLLRGTTALTGTSRR